MKIVKVKKEKLRLGDVIYNLWITNLDKTLILSKKMKEFYKNKNYKNDDYFSEDFLKVVGFEKDYVILEIHDQDFFYSKNETTMKFKPWGKVKISNLNTPAPWDVNYLNIFRD